MTGQQFESEFCELLKVTGYWALNIPKNQSGAQPFDVIALHGNLALAVDCKVCSTSFFPLERVEDNQWLAFQTLNERTNAKVGVVVYFKGDIYFIPYQLLKDSQRAGLKSIKFTLLKKYWSKEMIKDTLGRYME